MGRRCIGLNSMLTILAGKCVDQEGVLKSMVGHTITQIETDKDEAEGSERICFTLDNGYTVCLKHDYDCCEFVRIEDVCGDLDDLIGSPLLLAEVVSNDYNEGPVPDGSPQPPWCYSYTWTFYKFATNKGAVTIRWLGESNGCYSEKVDMYVIAGRDPILDPDPDDEILDDSDGDDIITD